MTTNRVLLAIYTVNAALYGIVTCLYASEGKLVVAGLWLVGTAVWVACVAFRIVAMRRT